LAKRAAVPETPVVFRPKRDLPPLPLGKLGKRASRQVRAASSGTDRDASKEVIWKGNHKGSVADIRVKTNSTVLFNSVLLEVAISDIDVDGGMVEKQDVLYAQASYDSSRSLYDQVPLKNTDEAMNAPKSGGLVVRWDYDVPGIVDEVCVNLGSIVAPGDVLMIIKTSQRHQHLAYLTAADQIGFQNLNKATSINTKFQVLTEKLVSRLAVGPHIDVLGTIHCCSELERVTRDFLETARTYGRVIIRYS
jgi:hypothetical protein